MGAVALTAAAVLSAMGCQELPDLPNEAEILWDEWGVPHVFASSEEELARGLGWAQMEAHGEAILRLYAEARGEGARHYGSSALPLDRFHHAVGLPELAERWETAQSPEFRAVLDGFARGVNEWAERHGDALSEAARSVLPVTSRDPLAHAIRAVHFTFIASPAYVQQQEALWRQLPAGPRATALSAASNSWAVSPDRTRDGHPLLLVNPHLPWPNPHAPEANIFRFFELHLTGPRGSFYGATLIGLPTGGLGFNEHLGWTHTVNTYDGVDLYRVRLAGDGAGYLLDGEVRQFQVDSIEVAVLTEAGDLETVRTTRRQARHGPVVTEPHDGEVLALRVAGLDAPGALEQWWELMWSRSLDEFQSVLRRMQLPMFNVVYADRDGNIMKFYNGLVPQRPHGSWSEWQVPVDGTRSENLWEGYLGFEELPRVVNPETGWVQNANEPPWQPTLPSPLHPENFPAHLSPRDPGPGVFRTQASQRLLMEGGTDLTLEALDRLRSVSRSEAADRLLDDLLDAARELGGETAREAARVLSDWDRSYAPDSRGAALFSRWYEHYVGAAFAAQRAEARSLRALAELGPVSDVVFEEAFDSSADPFATPRGLGQPELAVRALDQAVGELRGQGIELDAPWGEVARMRVGDHDLPASGGSSLETFRVLSVAPDPAGGYRVVAGDTFILAVEFGEIPRARALLTYGNATREGSPHVGDQLEPYLQDRMREVRFSREDVERNAVRRVPLGGPPVD